LGGLTDFLELTDLTDLAVLNTSSDVPGASSDSALSETGFSGSAEDTDEQYMISQRLHEGLSAFAVWTQCGLLSPQSLANFAETRFRSAIVPG
jgi:hypothetical protein